MPAANDSQSASSASNASDALRSRLRSSYSRSNSSNSSSVAPSAPNRDTDTKDVKQSMRQRLLGGNFQNQAEKQQIENEDPETLEVPTSVQLEVAEQVINETLERRQESMPQDVPKQEDQLQDPTAQAFPQVVEQQYQQQLNPPNAASVGQRESLATPNSPDFSGIDHIPGVQSVEHEPNPELSPEVASFLEKAEKNEGQLPEEITVAEDAGTSMPRRTPKKAVVVLPITPEVEKQGMKKSPSWSIRWLVEWSRKIMKMFSGDVIYRES